MTKQIFPFIFCFIRELNLHSPLTFSLTSARELNPFTPRSPSPSTHSTLKKNPSVKSMGARFEQKNSLALQHKTRCNYKTNSSESIERHQYADV